MGPKRTLLVLGHGGASVPVWHLFQDNSARKYNQGSPLNKERAPGIK